MLEFNIPAFKSTADFMESIQRVLGTMDAEILSKQKLEFVFEPMHTFKPEEIAPFPQAFTVGCMPDMNAYAEGKRFNREPMNIAQFGNNRFCGGHLHVQYNKGHVPPHVFAQFMDLVVEISFLRQDKQRMRRIFYGQAGIFRDKPYGIEYRTPSNFWLSRAFREKHLLYMMENIFWLARAANTEESLLKKAYSKIDWGDVHKAINTENVKLADEIHEFCRNELHLPLYSTHSS